MKKTPRNRLPVLLLLAALNLSLSGCGYLLRHRAPVVDPVPDQYLHAETADSLDTGPWWPMFGDGTLDALMDSALSSNLTLAQAAARLDQFRAVNAAARSSLFPTVTVQGTDQDGKTKVSSGPSAGKFDVVRYDVRATAAWEVDLWGRLSASRRASYADYLAGENDLRAVVLSISSQVAQTYYQAVEFRAQVDLLTKTIQSYEEYYQLVRDRYILGVVPAVDVYQAEINLAQAKSRKAAYEANLARTEHALSILIGRYPENDLVSGGTDKLPTGLDPPSSGLPSELLKRRPDIRAAYHRMRAADFRWAEAVANRFPTITLTGTANNQSNDLADALDPDEMAFNLAAGVVAPIIDGGRRSAEAKRTHAAFRESAAAYQQAVLNGFGEVEDALISGLKLREQLNALADQERAAGHSLRTASERYRQGLTDYLPVLLAQTSHYNAQSALITTRRELITNRIQLVTALGGGWTDDVIRNYHYARKIHSEEK